VEINWKGKRGSGKNPHHEDSVGPEGVGAVAIKKPVGGRGERVIGGKRGVRQNQKNRVQETSQARLSTPEARGVLVESNLHGRTKG